MGNHILHFCVTSEWLVAPSNPHTVRWILDSDLHASAEPFDPGQGRGWTLEEWLELKEQGYLYCGHFRDRRLCSMAGIWKRAPDVWEVIAVHTRKGYRRRGLARAGVYFAARHILDHVRVASYTTLSNNVGSIRTALSLGFRPCTHVASKEKWCALAERPPLPDGECPLIR